MIRNGYHSSDERKAQMRNYYYKNKNRWLEYRTRANVRIKLKRNKGVADYYSARAKCLWYLVKIKKCTYRQAANRFRISDPNTVRKVIKRMERKLNG